MYPIPSSSTLFLLFLLRRNTLVSAIGLCVLAVGVASIVCVPPCRAQVPGVQYRYELCEPEGIVPERYRERRAHVLAAMPDSAVALFFAADVRNRQSDVDYPYRQESNLLYLTGIAAPEVILLLVPKGVRIGNGDTTVYRELLFVPERKPSKEMWVGVQPGPQEAEKYYGIAKALPMEQWKPLLDTVLRRSAVCYVTEWPTGSVRNPLTGTTMSLAGMAREEMAERYPQLALQSQKTLLSKMREKKDADELRLMQKAVDITVAGFVETMQQAQPGMAEYELEAIMEHAFYRLGAHDVGYPSIVGTGPNTCLLHYTTNRRTSKQGELALMDCGAEYFGYTADITRTFPLSGKFSMEQKLLYNIVLEAQDSAFAACKAGNDWRLPHSRAVSVIRRRLLEEQIIAQPEDYLWYFMHGTSHYLGLDVHDVGTYGKFQPGVVLTVEPGLYIPEGSPCDPKWWNIGIRIEDDVVVTDGEPRILSATLPRTVRDIERLMEHASGVRK